MSPVFRSRSPVASPRRIHSSPGLLNQRCRCWLRRTRSNTPFIVKHHVCVSGWSCIHDECRPIFASYSAKTRRCASLIISGYDGSNGSLSSHSNSLAILSIKTTSEGCENAKRLVSQNLYDHSKRTSNSSLVRFSIKAKCGVMPNVRRKGPSEGMSP